jgi:integrase
VAAKVKRDRGAWWVITHYEGKRRKQRVGPTNSHKREAEQIAKRINAALLLGMFVPTQRESGIPFDTYASAWLEHEVMVPTERSMEGALSPATAALHRRHVTLYLTPFFGSKDLREIRVADVQGLVDRCLRQGRPPSARSIEMVVATLGRIMTYAEAREEIIRNPVEAWKRARGRRRRSSGYRVDPENVLDSEELDLVLEVAQAHFPDFYPFILFLADTGARLGEASGLRWIDVDLTMGTARICRSFSGGRYMGPTKTGKTRVVELSARLHDALEATRPDLYGDQALVFPSETGGLLDPNNFRARVFNRIVREALGRGKRFTPHGLRHTFASLHMARGTNLKWIQAQGGWASAKVLLDWYGHHLPTEMTGYADALSNGPGRPQTAPRRKRSQISGRHRAKTPAATPPSLAPREGIEPPTRCLEGSCSIRLSYRGAGRG